jgi:phosphoribosyl 1,2-cyclic phosphate phosphodiesterase
VVVLDGLRTEPHASHMSIAEAVVVAQEIGAPQTYLTHLTHGRDHSELAAKLPPGIAPAHDGLRVRL